MFNQYSTTFFKVVVCNPCQSSPSLTILVPLWFIIISLMFFYLSELLFSGFLQFKGNLYLAKLTQTTVNELLQGVQYLGCGGKQRY